MLHTIEASSVYVTMLFNSSLSWNGAPKYADIRPISIRKNIPSSIGPTHTVPAKGKNVANKELWQELMRLLKEHEVSFDTENDIGYQSWLVTEINRKERTHV